MTGWQWFWFIMTIVAVGWYSTVTVYVAIKGVFDIRGMLRRLAEGHEPD